MEFQAPGVSLGQLLDNMLQKTYHDLSVLAELLPRKHDMERKIEIVKFATRARQQFIRLLALVKWADSAQCLDKCQEIMAFLEKQSLFYASTADQLHHLAKGTLASARLPNFALPVAVDVLATGTYSRLPAVIKEKIVPETPLSPDTDKDTRKTLEGIICQRLVATELPDELRNFSIGNGRVTFTAKDEFEVALTVINPNFTMPWRLLSLKILVKDPKRPKAALVLPQQIEYLHRLAQAQLFQTESPLEEMYKCIHSFCVSLQLEVLHSQARHLMEDSPLPAIETKSYVPGNRLAFEYWKPQVSPHSMQGAQPADKTGSGKCQLQIVVENTEPDAVAPLRLDVLHTPSLPTMDVESGDCHRWQPVALNLSHLCVESLTQQAIEIRIASRLQSLFTYLRQYPLYKDRVKFHQESLHLLVELNDDQDNNEVLMIYVESQAGSFCAKLLPEDPTKLLKSLELGPLLNKAPTINLIKCLDRLRARIVLLHCRRKMEARGWSVHSRLPMSPVVSVLSKIGADYVLIKLARQPLGYLVVEVIQPKGSVAGLLDIRCHLLHTWHCQYNGQAVSSTSSNSSTEQSDAHRSGFLNALLSPLDAALYVGPLCKDRPSLVHGLRRKIPRLLEEDGDSLAPLRVGEAYVPPAPLLPSIGWIGLLADMTEQLVPFSTFLTQLSSHGFSHANIRVDREAGLSVYITRFPTPPGACAEAAAQLSDSLISCQILSPVSRSSGHMAVFQFTNCPIQTLHPDGSPSVRRVVHPITAGSPPAAYLQLLWNAMINMYASVLELSAYLEDSSCETSRQCCVVTFNHLKLCLAYGPGFRYTVTVAGTKLSKVEFGVLTESQRQLALAGRSSDSCPPDCRESRACLRNPHVLLGDALSLRFSSTRSIPLLMQGLHHTLPPLLALSQVFASPAYGLGMPFNIPRKQLSVLPRSPSAVCIIYKNIYQLEIEFKMDGILLIRDCGYGLSGKLPKNSFTEPMLHFKDFLLSFLAAHGSGRGPQGVGGKFVIGSSVPTIFASMPMPPPGGTSQQPGASSAASSQAAGDDAVPATASAVADDVTAAVDVDALMRDLQQGSAASGGSVPSSASPRPPVSVGDSGLSSMDDVNATPPGGLMEMFSPSFVDASPGNMATPSPATLKALTGVKPISVNSPATLPWALGGGDSDFSSTAAGVDTAMDVGPYDGWSSSLPWTMSDPTNDPSMLIMSSGADPLAVPLPTQSTRTAMPPVLPASTSITMPSMVASSAQTEGQSSLLSSQSSITFSRRTSVAATVGEPTPDTVTADARIPPPEALATILAQQKGSDAPDSWYNSSPVLVSHHCWFELLRLRAVSCRDAPSFPSLPEKSESQDSGISSMKSDPFLSDPSAAPPMADTTFVQSPLEGYLGSMYMFKQWQLIARELSFRVVNSQSLSITIANNYGLQCRVWLDLEWSFLLQIAIERTDQPAQSQGSKGVTLKDEDLRLLETLFLAEAACPPYRRQALHAFGRLFGLRGDLLLEIVKVVRCGQDPDVNFLWRPKLCLVIPPSVRAPTLASPGEPAIALKAKLLFLVSLAAFAVSNPEGADGDKALRPIVLAFVHNPGTNDTEYLDFASSDHRAGYVPTPSIDATYSQRVTQAAKQTMSKWRAQQSSIRDEQPSLSSAVLFVCRHLSVGNAKADPLAL